MEVLAGDILTVAVPEVPQPEVREHLRIDCCALERLLQRLRLRWLHGVRGVRDRSWRLLYVAWLILHMQMPDPPEMGCRSSQHASMEVMVDEGVNDREGGDQQGKAGCLHGE